MSVMLAYAICKLMLAGTVNENSVPSPGVLVTHILPLHFSTRSLQNNSPIPVPDSLFVPVLLSTLFLNSFFSCASGMPVPVSFTLITISCSFSEAKTSITSFSPENLMALVIKLRITMRMELGSADPCNSSDT